MKNNYLKIINSLNNYLDEKKIIAYINKTINYPDEPQIYHFSASLNNIDLVSDGKSAPTTASGFSFDSQPLALLKCLMEAIERYASMVYRKSDLVFKDFNSLKEKNAVDPILFDKSESFRNKKIAWVAGENLLDKKKTLIPAQAIYYNYAHQKKEEPHLTTHISTGTAAGFDLESTTLRGIYEVIERDSFMSYYLSGLIGKRLDLSKLKIRKLTKLLNKIVRYNLEIQLFDITTDLKVPTVLALIVDRTSLGQSLSFGLKSSLNFETAILGSLEEAIHIRTWMRWEMIKRGDNSFSINPKEITSFLDRGLFWLSPNMIEKFEPWLSQPPHKIKLPKEKLNTTSELKKVLALLRAKEVATFYIDITPPKFKELGGYVGKVVIPQLQPIYFQETNPEIRLKRLKEVTSFFNREKVIINQLPHPFL